STEFGGMIISDKTCFSMQIQLCGQGQGQGGDARSCHFTIDDQQGRCNSAIFFHIFWNIGPGETTNYAVMNYDQQMPSILQRLRLAMDHGKCLGASRFQDLASDSNSCGLRKVVSRRV